MQDIRTSFSKRLQAERLKKKLTVYELADKSGLSPKHVYELESGTSSKRVTITTIEKLARALKVPAWKLIKF